MAVIDQSYRRWLGQPTTYLQRVLVIPRYDLMEILARRAWLMAWVACLLPPLVLATLVYVATNIDILRTVVPAIPPGWQLPAPGASAYGTFMAVQCWLLTGFAILVGPPLATRDFANGAIPLYLSKSLRRHDYILGRCAVLAILLSLASWIPYLAVFAAECGMTDAAWRAANWRLAWDVIVATIPTVILLSVLIAAVGAIVHRGNLARAALLFLLLATRPLAMGLEAAVDSPSMRVVSPTHVTQRLREWSFDRGSERELAALRGTLPLPDASDGDLSPWLAVMALAAWGGGAVFVLARRVRPVEVVR